MPRAQDAAMIDRRTAAASIDTYYEANLLTGEASSPSLEELTRRALKIKEDGERLFVHWTSPVAAIECQAIGPVPAAHYTSDARGCAQIIAPTIALLRAAACISSSPCRFAFLNFMCPGDALLLTFVVVARMVRDLFEALPLPRRRLACFSYIPGRGSTHLRCSCKHTHEEHRTSDGRAAPCSHPGCGCSGFHSSWRCGSCGEDYDAHFTLFETAKERAACGKPVEANLGGWSDEKPHLDAVCGGVTRMSSLLSGVERTGLVANLPHTDGGAGTRGDGLVSEVVVPAALSSTAAVFANYDRRADAHVAKLKKAREASEARKFASGTHGHKLGGTPPQLAAAVLMGPAPPAGSARAAVGQRPAAPPKSATAAPPKSAITVAGGVTVARDGASVQPQPPRGPPPGAMRPAAGGGGVGRPR